MKFEHILSACAGRFVDVFVKTQIFQPMTKMLNHSEKAKELQYARIVITQQSTKLQPLTYI